MSKESRSQGVAALAPTEEIRDSLYIQLVTLKPVYCLKARLKVL